MSGAFDPKYEFDAPSYYDEDFTNEQKLPSDKFFGSPAAHGAVADPPQTRRMTARLLPRRRCLPRRARSGRSKRTRMRRQCQPSHPSSLRQRPLRRR